MFRDRFVSLFLLVAVALALTLTKATTAGAAPLKLKNARAVRVKVNGDSKPGLQLTGEEAGWRLKLEGAAALVRLSVIDVTPGTPAQTLSIRVNGGEALFDANRFQGGHVYRVWAPGADGASFVYLQPSATVAAPAARGSGRVDFDEGEKAVADESPIEPAKKGSL